MSRHFGLKRRSRSPRSAFTDATDDMLITSNDAAFAVVMSVVIAVVIFGIFIA